MVLSGPTRQEWYQGEPEEQVQVRPKDLPIDALRCVKHVMVIVPVNTEVDEAQNIGNQGWNDGSKVIPTDSLRGLELQNHDRDEDRDHTIAESFQPRLMHRFSSVPTNDLAGFHHELHALKFGDVR